jgi:curved DNA-binding protein CbpA
MNPQFGDWQTMNYYVVLGIPEDADEETTRRAFRALVRRYHPDAGAGSSPDKFREIVDAYETLRDPVRRASYDSSLRTERNSIRQASVEPVHAEPLRTEPLVEPLGVRFRNRGRYSHSALIVDNRAENRFEELLDQMLVEVFGDEFFRRLF